MAGPAMLSLPLLGWFCWVFLKAIITISTGYELISKVVKYQRFSDVPPNGMEVHCYSKIPEAITKPVKTVQRYQNQPQTHPGTKATFRDARHSHELPSEVPESFMSD